MLGVFGFSLGLLRIRHCLGENGMNEAVIVCSDGFDWSIPLELRCLRDFVFESEWKSVQVFFQLKGR